MSHSAPLNALAILERAGLRPKKSWGQNFLIDESAHRAIVEATGVGSGQSIVELGAGLGALTYFLLESGARVVAIERDRELVPLLRAGLEAFDNLEIREANAATLDYPALARELDEELLVVGNLPYLLSSRIMVSLAESADVVRRAVFLIQREVADRLAANPGGRERGLLSVLVQRRFTIEKIRSVAPGAFRPPPQVHSTVVRLERHSQTVDQKLDDAVVELARAGFASRRKNLRNGLRSRLKPALVDNILVLAGIDGTRRAETLSIDEWQALATLWLRQSNGR